VNKWIVIIVIVLALAGGGVYYFFVYRPAAAKADAPAVVTAKVERGPIKQIVASTGRVVSNLDVDIKCKASGEVTKLPFDVSDVVKKNDLLLELDPVDQGRIVRQAEVRLSASQAKLQIARENLAVAERTLVTDRARAEVAVKSCEVRSKDSRAKADRMKALLEKKLISPEDCDTAETAAVQAAADLDNAKVKVEELKTQELALELSRQQVKLSEADAEGDKIALDIAKDRLEDTKVYAPIDGIVASRPVLIGQIIASGVSNVGGGTTFLTLSDLSRIFVVAAVDESDIGKVALGQAVTVTVDAFPLKEFKGTVVRIAAKGVNLSNVVTFEVKIEVTGNAKELLKPEMTANVKEILIAEKSDVLLVPCEAIVRKGRGKQIVTLVKEGAENEDVTVETGITDGTKTEVVTGLTEGQTVLVRKGALETMWAGAQKGPGGGAVRGTMMGGPPRR
jgi:HlyD family secretion protein